jgi:sialate O-acetylesterase
MRGLVFFKFLFFSFLLLFIFNSNVLTDVKLSKLFTDHMMLQRDKPIKIWGIATPGVKVKVSLADKVTEVIVGNDGKWLAQLPALDKGENLELVVVEQNTITIKDIIIGDIWLCSGQSNMEFKLGNMASFAAEEIQTANFPKIRYLLVGGGFTPYKQEETGGGNWRVCSPTTAKEVSAVAFFFSREINQKTQVPIGILECDWSGTSIEPWIPMEGIMMVPELKSTLDKIESDYKVWVSSIPKMASDAEKWAVDAREAAKTNSPFPSAPALQGPPGYNIRDYWCNIYNGKIHPIVGFPIKGAIWYQGESNGGQGDGYLYRMRALIGGWRKVWNQGDFPFYFVQLANFQEPNDVPAGADGWSATRIAQLDSLKIPNTGMAVAIDIGEAKDIHPKDKLNVGLRLSRWALARDYGFKDIIVSGPLFKEMKIEGSSIRISFDFVGSGLMVGRKATIESKNWREPATEDKESKLNRFAIAGQDKVWYWADAVIDGQTIKVSSPKVPEPIAVRYAYSQNPLGANLYNKDGLPASPFRTDTWNK